MWGQAVPAKSTATFRGIIPTRVGTSNSLWTSTQINEDHPHACGDKYNSSDSVGAVKGSSPRVWGQAMTVEKAFLNCRIIPTRVGTRWIAVINLAVNEDHPHACGDKAFSSDIEELEAGSSPRVWGQVNIPCRAGVRLRIIPTRVGTSKKIKGRPLPPRDHPHACGDK